MSELTNHGSENAAGHGFRSRRATSRRATGTAACHCYLICYMVRCATSCSHETTISYVRGSHLIDSLWFVRLLGVELRVPGPGACACYCSSSR
jgi:hypothetical protein